MEIGDEVEITARRKFLKLAGAGAFAVPAVMGGTGAYGQQGSTEISVHGSGMFDVKAFGAKGDGTTIDTPAINRAIEAASASGGTVRFAAGQYLCYSIHLKSNVALYLEQGAVIIAAGRTIRGIRRAGAGAGLGGLPGLRAQSLAQQPDLGRRPSRCLNLWSRAHLGPGIDAQQ
jgi:hypothetical protein